MVNSANSRDLVHTSHKLQSEDGKGVGHLDSRFLTADSRLILNNIPGEGWHEVPKCFITNKWRFFVVFIDRSQAIKQQNFYLPVPTSGSVSR